MGRSTGGEVGERGAARAGRDCDAEPGHGGCAVRPPTLRLRELEERRDPALLFRAHKSSLVNLKHVKEVAPWFGGRYKLAMRDAAGSEGALSRVQTRTLRARLRW